MNKSHVDLYTDNIYRLLSLNTTQLKIILYVMSRIRPGDHTVGIVWNECMRATGLKHKGSLYKERDKLIRSGILTATTDRNVYYFDTSIFFREV